MNAVNAVVLLRELVRQDIHVSVQAGALVVDAPRGALASELKARITEHKAELVAWLTSPALALDAALSEVAQALPEAPESPTAASAPKPRLKPPPPKPPPLTLAPLVMDPDPSRVGRLTWDGRIFEHYCAVCGAWGTLGFGVNLLKGEVGTWFCRAHKPDPLLHDHSNP